jgi:hypothetical protein
VSQRHRHEYAADLPHGLPGPVKEPSREVPTARSGGTHRARPVSTRFEPVHEIKDVTTPVPRVLLSATLAGPAPSGSAGTSRLCQGCSHPPRHHPDQAAPSFTALLRQDEGEGLSPPLEQQRPLRRVAQPRGAALKPWRLCNADLVPATVLPCPIKAPGRRSCPGGGPARAVRPAEERPGRGGQWPFEIRLTMRGGREVLCRAGHVLCCLPDGPRPPQHVGSDR